MLVMEELKSSRVSVTLHVAAGLVTGWLASILGSMFGDMIAVVMGIAVLLLVGYLTESLLRRKGVKWWLGNGGILFLFFWLIGWVFFLNLG